jgi:hypothetical protein
MSTRPRRASYRLADGTVMTALALLTAACGSTKPVSPGSGQGTPVTSIPVATSLGGAGQPGWAVVQMGGSAASEENFWELFARPAGSAQWRLATPVGVASNGGLMMAAAGTGLVAGFGPSQDLTFSPLAAVTAPGAAWSQNAAPVSPGLASVPDALASGPGGQLLALTRSGEVLQASAASVSGTGAAWTRVTTLRTLSASPAARACRLTALTAVGFTAAGAPEVGGACARPGAAAIFAQLPAGGWQAAGPAPAGQRLTVLGLATQTGRTTALLEVTALPDIRVLGAWSAAGASIAGGSGPSGSGSSPGASSWKVSPSVGIGPRQPRSVQMLGNGSAGLVLADGRGLTIAGPGGIWRTLPALPARTATLALGPAGQLQALTAAGEWFRVWQVAADGDGWSQVQQIKVQIPYGSSS